VRRWPTTPNNDWLVSHGPRGRMHSIVLVAVRGVCVRACVRMCVLDSEYTRVVSMDSMSKVVGDV
jgi:hypothetical protein